MLITPRTNPDFDDLLVKTGSALDIPSDVYEDATLKYEDVGNWLGAQDSDLLQYAPDIYVQGSFRLGTVVRPINDADEYDIDLVCRLEIAKEQTTQKKLKDLIGDRLKKRDDLAKIIEPSRRCWTLDYPAEDLMPHFHMDVLPAIPNLLRTPTGILITDTELTHWQWSNPRAYADWFYERMKVIFEEKRAALAESIQAKVEEVPEWQVKTPLQIVVQILKRHRDFHFQGREDDKPISIIITTLAARAYRNQPDVQDSLQGIVRDIEANWGKPGYVENRNGIWWVANPVDDGENFADKWNEYPERRLAFQQWVKKVRSDFTSAASKRTLNESVDALAPVLGKRTMTKAAQDLGLSIPSALPVLARAGSMVPALGDTRHCVAPTWRENKVYDARLSGTVHFKRAGRLLWPLTDSPVSRKLWLRFKLKTNTPPPYEVQWQVVNTGREAAAAGDLRGTIFRDTDEGDGMHWESTKYVGTHWVEAFIIKNGVCVARSGRKLVKIR
jgi:hypothetical protein